MARKWTEGFEMQDLVGYTVGTLTTISTAIKRSGAASCGVEYGAGGGSLTLTMPAGFSEGYFRFGLYLGSLEGFRFYWKNGSTVLGSLRIKTDGKVELYVGATLVATSTTILALSVWNLIELHVKIADIGTLEVKIEGILETALSFSGDTKPDTNTTMDTFSFDSTIAAYQYIDDIAINDTAGAADNSWCDDGKIIALLPNGTAAHQLIGSDADEIDNHLLVDEVPGDGDTTYVESGTVDQEDLYDLAACGLPANVNVRRVWAEARVRGTVAGDNKIALVTKAAGGLEVVGADIALPTSYTVRVLSAEQLVNPVDSAAWAPADLDALQAGPRIRHV